jgi:hypothetical protein
MHDLASVMELLIWAVYFLGVATGLIVFSAVKKILKYFRG